jgi:perosamine synthetase
MHKMIPVAGPWITQKEIDYVTDAVTHGWYENANGYINRFEQQFKIHTERKYAIALPSCTSAIHLSLLALDISPGDEVIVPDITWIGSSAPISYVGATPVFVDIDPGTWCLSAATIAPFITKKTKAIIAVNLYGNMPEYDELLALANKHGIHLVEDAAESIGSKYKNRPSGSFGTASCFSFHGSKTVVTGEGGMLVTDDEEFYKKCLILRDHGRNPGDTLFQNIKIGHKYKMSNLQAALGLAQLERINELVERKQEIFSFYHNRLKNIEGISLNPSHPDVKNSYWMTTAIFDSIYLFEKKTFIQEASQAGISLRPFFYPLSSLKSYKGFNKNKNKTAYAISERGINLPSAAIIKKSDVDYVCSFIEKRILQRGVAHEQVQILP